MRGPAPPSAIEVRQISFEGNGSAVRGHPDSALRSAMQQRKSPALSGLIRPRQRRVLLDEDILVLDAWRLEVWYAHRGHFDAKFRGWTLDFVRTRASRGLWKKPRAVRVRGVVDPGPAYVVSSLQVEGVEKLGGPFLARLLEEAPLREGDTFSLDALNETVALAERLLLDRSYAYVDVTPQVDVRPKQGKVVEVVLSVRLGPSCTFGPVTLHGLRSLPESLVRKELPLVPPEELERPQPFSMSTLASARTRLFGLGVFSVVNVVPELESRPSTAEAPEASPAPAEDSVSAWVPASVVPVRLDLVEGSAQQMRLGVGALVEGGRYQARVSADYSNANLLNRLVRLNWDNDIGYAVLPQNGLVDEDGGFALPDDRGLILLTEPELVVPHFPGRSWQATLGVSAELGVEQGYRFFSPRLTPALRWRATDRIDLELSYQLVFFDYLSDLTDLQAIANPRLGLDNSDPYTLSLLQQKVIYSSRDDLLFPRRGLYAEYELSEAGGPFGGQFSFLRLKADQRAYVPLLNFFGLRAPGAVAFRVGGGGILGYGEDAEGSTPIAERLYLGGSNDVRGWQTRQLGPYICDPDAGVACVSARDRARPVVSTDEKGRPVYADIIPVGGVLSLFASVELRVYSLEGLGFALFSDAGMAWLTYADAVPPILYPSVGAGLRYKLPFGAARLDVARRVVEVEALNPAMFEGEPLWNVHFGLAEAF